MRFLLASVFSFSLLLAQPINKAPKPVQDAFKKAYPNATVKAVSKEKEDGKVVYEVESVDGAQHRDILYAADGTAVEIEEAMPVKDLPGAVSKAVTAKYPKSPMLSAEKLTKGSETSYEVVIKSGLRKKEVQVSPDGKIL